MSVFLSGIYGTPWSGSVAGVRRFVRFEERWVTVFSGRSCRIARSSLPCDFRLCSRRTFLRCLQVLTFSVHQEGLPSSPTGMPPLFCGPLYRTSIPAYVFCNQFKSHQNLNFLLIVLVYNTNTKGIPGRPQSLFVGT